MTTPIAADGGASGTVTAEAVTPGETPEQSDVEAATPETTESVVGGETPYSSLPYMGGGGGKNAEQAQAQYEEDQKFFQENPETPLIREANPEVGGEAFI